MEDNKKIKLIIVGQADLSNITTILGRPREEVLIESNIDVKTCGSIQDLINDYKEQLAQYNQVFIENLSLLEDSSFRKELNNYSFLPATHEGKWFDKVPKNKIRNKHWK